MAAPLIYRFANGDTVQLESLDEVARLRRSLVRPQDSEGHEEVRQHQTGEKEEQTTNLDPRGVAT